MADIAGADCIQ